MIHKRNFLLILFLGIISNSFSSHLKDLKKRLSLAKTIEVSYESRVQGKVVSKDLLMTISQNQVSVFNKKNKKKTVESTFLDYTKQKSYRTILLDDGRRISSCSSFDLKRNMKEVGVDTLLGLGCKIVQVSINSNTIKIWYTDATSFKGTPASGFGVPNGLVLKYTFNGSRETVATKIKTFKKERELLPTSWGEMLEYSAYRYAIKNKDVKTITLFSNERLAATGGKMPARLDEEKLYHVGGGTVLLKKVKLPKGLNHHYLFLELVQHSNGDAYDRTGSVFMIPGKKKLSYLDALRSLKSVPAFISGDNQYPGIISTPEYEAPVELMRFFTSFGVGKFNHIKVPGQIWRDSILYKTDITHYASLFDKEVWIGTFIGNWDGNGHKVTLRLKFYPEGPDSKKQNVLPLFNTVSYLEQAGQAYPSFTRNDSLHMQFTLKKDVKNARLIYLTTGHGGWGGGDEFNQRLNTIYLDGQKVFSFIPWRNDCGTYRSSNPCSGNFSNGLSSSDLSRSNWCPGTVTVPEYVFIGNLKAGKHTICVKIPSGPSQGGSFSSWYTSGALVY